MVWRSGRWKLYAQDIILFQADIRNTLPLLELMTELGENVVKILYEIRKANLSLSRHVCQCQTYKGLRDHHYGCGSWPNLQVKCPKIIKRPNKVSITKSYRYRKLHNPTLQQRKWTKLSIERFWSIFLPQQHLSVQQYLCFSKNHPFNDLLKFIKKKSDKPWMLRWKLEAKSQTSSFSSYQGIKSLSLYQMHTFILVLRSNLPHFHL